MIVQFCGLSGSGKTTIANQVKLLLADHGVNCEVIDGDVYRKKICADLGFSKADRNENIRRLAAVANTFAKQNIVPVICAINPYDEVRQEIAGRYPQVKTVYIACAMDVLIKRDTKNLYRRALLQDGHPEKVYNLTGVNDTFEVPVQPDLILQTDKETIAVSTQRLVNFILETII